MVLPANSSLGKSIFWIVLLFSNVQFSPLNFPVIVILSFLKVCKQNQKSIYFDFIYSFNKKMYQE